MNDIWRQTLKRTKLSYDEWTIKSNFQAVLEGLNTLSRNLPQYKNQFDDMSDLTQNILKHYGLK